MLTPHPAAGILPPKRVIVMCRKSARFPIDCRNLLQPHHTQPGNRRPNSASVWASPFSFCMIGILLPPLSDNSDVELIDGPALLIDRVYLCDTCPQRTELLRKRLIAALDILDIIYI